MRSNQINISNGLNLVHHHKLNKHNSLCIQVLILLMVLIRLSHQQCCVRFDLTNSRCVQCPMGMRLYRGNCLFNLQNCVSYKDGFECGECKQGYQLVRQSNTCVQLNKNNSQSNTNNNSTSLIVTTQQQHTTTIFSLKNVTFANFTQLTRQQILSTDKLFTTKMFEYIMKLDKYSKLTNDQILYVYSKQQNIINNNKQFQQYTLYRILILTQTGFSDILLSISSNNNTITLLQTRQYNKVSQQSGYQYFDVVNDQIWLLLQSQVKQSKGFIIANNNNSSSLSSSTVVDIYFESQLIDCYMRSTDNDVSTMDEFLLYFVNRDYGLIEIAVQLQVLNSNNFDSKSNVSNISSSNQNSINSTTNNNNNNTNVTSIVQTTTNITDGSNNTLITKSQSLSSLSSQLLSPSAQIPTLQLSELQQTNLSTKLNTSIINNQQQQQSINISSSSTVTTNESNKQIQTNNITNVNDQPNKLKQQQSSKNINAHSNLSSIINNISDFNMNNSNDTNLSIVNKDINTENIIVNDLNKQQQHNILSVQQQQNMPTGNISNNNTNDPVIKDLQLLDVVKNVTLIQQQKISSIENITSISSKAESSIILSTSTNQSLPQLLSQQTNYTNTNTNITVNATNNNTQSSSLEPTPNIPTTTSTSAIQQSIQLINTFNFTLLDNFTQITETQYAQSSLYDNITKYLSQQRPSLYTMNKQKDIVNNYDIINYAVYNITLKQIINISINNNNKKTSSTINNTLLTLTKLNQLYQSPQLQTITCIIYRLTFQISQLQPYQAKVLILAKEKQNNISNIKSGVNNSSNDSLINVDNQYIYLMKIIAELGDPQIDNLIVGSGNNFSSTNNNINNISLISNNTTTTNSTPSTKQTITTPSIIPTTTSTTKIIPYPSSSQKTFIQHVRLFLQMQYGDVIQQAQLINYTVQQKNMSQKQILNMSKIKRNQLKNIEMKNDFGLIFKVFNLTFRQKTGIEMVFCVQYKKNQLDVVKVPVGIVAGGNDSGQQQQGQQISNISSSEWDVEEGNVSEVVVVAEGNNGSSVNINVSNSSNLSNVSNSNNITVNTSNITTVNTNNTITNTSTNNTITLNIGSNTNSTNISSNNTQNTTMTSQQTTQDQVVSFYLYNNQSNNQNGSIASNVSSVNSQAITQLDKLINSLYQKQINNNINNINNNTNNDSNTKENSNITFLSSESITNNISQQQSSPSSINPIYTLSLVELRTKSMITQSSIKSFTTIIKTELQKIYTLYYLTKDHITLITNKNTTIIDNNNNTSDSGIDNTLLQELVYSYQVGISNQGVVSLYKVNKYSLQKFINKFIMQINTTYIKANNIIQPTIKTDSKQSNIKSKQQQTDQNNTSLSQPTTAQSSQTPPSLTNTSLNNISSYAATTKTNQTYQQNSSSIIINPIVNGSNQNNNTSLHINKTAQTQNNALNLPSQNINNDSGGMIKLNTIAKSKYKSKSQEEDDSSYYQNDSKQSLIPHKYTNNNNNNNNNNQPPTIITDNKTNNQKPSPPTNTPSTPLSISHSQVNRTFNSLEQFTANDVNWGLLSSFIGLIDGQRVANDDDVKIVYRLLWGESYLRYLIVYGKEQQQNNTNDNRGNVLSNNMTANKNRSPKSALSIFQLQLQSTQYLPTKSTSNHIFIATQSQSSTTSTEYNYDGDVVILSINDQSKYIQYQRLISKSNLINLPNSLNDYYYNNDHNYYNNDHNHNQQKINKGQKDDNNEQINMRNMLQQKLLNQLVMNGQSQQNQYPNILSNSQQNIIQPKPPIPPLLHSQSSLQNNNNNNNNKPGLLRKQQQQDALLITPIISKQNPMNIISKPDKKHQFTRDNCFMGILSIQSIQKQQQDNQQIINNNPSQQQQVDKGSFVRRFYQNTTSSNGNNNNNDFIQRKQNYNVYSIVMSTPNSRNYSNQQVSTITTSNHDVDNKNSNCDNITFSIYRSDVVLSSSSILPQHEQKHSSNNNNNINTSTPLNNNNNNSNNNINPPKQFTITTSNLIQTKQYQILNTNPQTIIKMFIQKIHTMWNLKIFSKNDTKQGLFFIVPEHVITLDTYFKAAQSFIFYQHKLLSQGIIKNVKISFSNVCDGKKSNSTINNNTIDTQSSNNKNNKLSSSSIAINTATNTNIKPQPLSLQPSTENEFIRLLSTLSTKTIQQIQSSKQFIDFQQFMSRNFKLITYQIKYLLADYKQNKVREYIVKSKYNKERLRYDVIEYRVSRVYQMQEMQQFIQDNFDDVSFVDGRKGCQMFDNSNVGSRRNSNSNCVRCKQGYVMTNVKGLFYSRENIGQQFYGEDQKQMMRMVPETVCERVIPNCKYQFIDSCVECQQGYHQLTNQKLLSSLLNENDISHQCVSLSK